MAPRVLVALDTWRTIQRELDRVSPREGVVLPLVNLVRNAGAPHPCATTTLEDLDAVVLAGAVLVPPADQQNSMVNVHVLGAGDDAANREAAVAVAAAPGLLTAAYLHSHPFAAGSTHPSQGDVDGHMRPLLERNAETGLVASFSFIACRAVGRRGWVLQAFAMDAQRNVVTLGDAELVMPTHPHVVAARLPPVRHRGGDRVLAAWREAARTLGWLVREDDLLEGWVRLRMQQDGVTVVALLDPVSVAMAHVFIAVPGEPLQSIHAVHPSAALALARAALSPDSNTEVLHVSA